MLSCSSHPSGRVRIQKYITKLPRFTLQEYCDSKWAMLRSYLKIPSNTGPNDPVARLVYVYVLKVLTVAASEIRHKDGIPPLVIFDNTAQILTKPGGIQTVHLLQDKLKMHLMTALWWFCSHQVKAPCVISCDHVLRSQNCVIQFTLGIKKLFSI